MSSEILFPMTERLAGSVDSSGAFPLGGRTRWTGSLRIARIAGSLTVLVEVSSTGNTGDWVTVATFGPLAATGETVLDGTIAGGAGNFTTRITERDLFLRGRISQCTGNVVFDLALDAPFIDWRFTGDLALLTKELRQWGDGLERILRQAEADVLSLLVRRPAALGSGLFDTHVPEVVSSGSPADYLAAAGRPTGLVWDCDPTLPGFPDAIRMEIADQAEHLFQRDKLRRSSEPSALVTWRGMGPLAPALGRRLEPYRQKTRRIWRGR